MLTLPLLFALASPQATTVNVGISLRKGQNVLHQAGAWTVFVDESAEVRAIDAATGAAISTGLLVAQTTVNATPAPLTVLNHIGVRNPFALFEVDEAALGQDVNGDGVLDDRIGHVLDLRDGTATSTGIASVNWASFRVQGNRISFTGREDDNGDANGDGDLSDTVAYLFDAHAKTTRNLGLDGFAALDGSDVLISVSEAAQGNADLNGDGDSNDWVLFRHDIAANRTINLGVAGSGAGLEAPNDLIVISEFQEGQDLTGDGQQVHEVWHALGAAGTPAQSIGLAISFGTFSSPIAAARRFVALLIPESGVGAGTDVNQDGDLTDRFVYSYSPRTRTAEALGLEAAAIFDAQSLGASRSVITTIGEAQLGSDQNGDGDAVDVVARQWKDGTIVTLPYAVNFVATDGASLLASVDEIKQGQDLNGDGALNGSFPIVSDFTTTTILPWPTALPFEITKDRFYTVRLEQDAGIDWTGNGNLDDAVLFSVAISDGSITNHEIPIELTVPFIPAPMAFGGGRAAVTVPESSANVDLNGDGDTFDLVLHVALP